VAQLCSIYVNAHLEKGHRALSPMEFVFDEEARGRKGQPGKPQTPAQQQAIFEAWAAGMKARHAKKRSKRNGN
jgi:hypothetical protein